MPHYAFVCKDCHAEFEKVLHIEELGKQQVECPECKSKNVEQTVATFSAVTSRKS